MKFNWYLLLLAITLPQVQCSTLKQSLKKSSGKGVTIELKAKAGSLFDTRFYSHAFIRTYSDQQLIREKHEAVDFTIRTSVSEYNPVSKTMKYKVKTIVKDGAVNLHELAFPEKFEELEYVVRSNGQVLQAGAYAPDSLFFVPSLPIPTGPVEVGDTWVLEHAWLSASDSIPLKLEIVGILKDLVSCEGGKQCADIEISGSVKLGVKPSTTGARFASRIWGRVLFSIERGDVIWSEVRSEEEMITQGEKVAITSCMVSETKSGTKYKTKLNCDPGSAPVAAVPQL